MIEIKILDLWEKKFIVESDSTLIPKIPYRATADLIKRERGKSVFLYSNYLAKIFCIKKEHYYKFIKNKNEKIPSVFLKYGLFNKIPYEEYVTEDKSTSDIDLSPILSSKCNLNCRYCALHPCGEFSTPLNVVERAIDFFYKKYEGVKLSIGRSEEPTQLWNSIKKIIKHARERKVEIYLITNGVLSVSKLNWLVRNIKKLSVSYDGLPEIQDKNRRTNNNKPTSRSVERTIEYLVNKRKDFDVLAVITKDFIGKEKKVIRNLVKLGIKNFAPSIILNEGKAKRIPKPTISESVASLFKCCELLEEVNIYTDYINFRLERYRTPCKLNRFCTDSKGNISGCPIHPLENGVFSEKYRELFVGRYDFAREKFCLFENKLKKMQNLPYENSTCKECEFYFMCANGCPKMNIEKKGNINAVNREHCRNRKLLYERAINYFIEKYFIKKKPLISSEGKNLTFNLIYNQFVLQRNISRCEKSEGALININNKTNLRELSEKIVEINKKSSSLHLFLVSFDISEFEQSLQKGREIIAMLQKLKDNRIYFKITKPLPKCLLGIEHERAVSEFAIPNSCYDCLEMYTVKKGRVVFCNGEKGKKLDNYQDRNEIFQDFKSEKRFNEKCTSCVYRMRKECEGICVSKNLKRM